MDFKYSLLRVLNQWKNEQFSLRMWMRIISLWELEKAIFNHGARALAITKHLDKGWGRSRDSWFVDPRLMVQGLWSLIYLGTSELGLPENSGMGNEMVEERVKDPFWHPHYCYQLLVLIASVFPKLKSINHQINHGIEFFQFSTLIGPPGSINLASIIRNSRSKNKSFSFFSES